MSDSTKSDALAGERSDVTETELELEVQLESNQSEVADDSTSSKEEITEGLVNSLRTRIRDLAASTGKSLGQTILAMTDLSHPITLTLLSAQSETSALGHGLATARCASEIAVKFGFQYLIRPAETEGPVGAPDSAED